MGAEAMNNKTSLEDEDRPESLPSQISEEPGTRFALEMQQMHHRPIQKSSDDSQTSRCCSHNVFVFLFQIFYSFYADVPSLAGLLLHGCGDGFCYINKCA